MKNEGISLLSIVGFALVIMVLFNTTVDAGLFKEMFTALTWMLGILYIFQVILIFIPVIQNILKEK